MTRESAHLPATALRSDVFPHPDAPPSTAGLASFARLFFAGVDVQPTWDGLMARATSTPPDVGAMLDLSTMLQLAGQRDEGLALQADALQRERRFRRVVGTGDGPTLLALVAAGDLMASTPVDFLLSGWNGVLDLMFVTAGERATIAIPDHDAAILAVGESDANATILAALEEPARRWPKPMLNASAAGVRALGRDQAPMRLASCADVDAPPTLRLKRSGLAALASVGAEAVFPGRAFPLIVRPVDSHAGDGLEKLAAAADIAGYLSRHPHELFYVSPFVDYAGPDRRYRKLRVALVDGRPFIVHMAVSEHWMVHYLNAGMDSDAGKRAEEAAAMASFDDQFARRHAAAFAAVHAAFGLDYLAIDCAEDREGRLLVFEADTAMIVHDMDPPDRYPYKAPAMTKLFAAFQAMVAARAD
jgi:glutathione synthase/RimK-type ligase-like ATP-grasp enzyme